MGSSPTLSTSIKTPGRRNRTPACLHAPRVEVSSEHQPDSPLQTGFMVDRETDVAVYNLMSLFELPEPDSNVESQLLVLRVRIVPGLYR